MMPEMWRTQRKGILSAALGASLLVGAPDLGHAADAPAAKRLPPVAAAPSTPIDIAFSARIASDYNFRGISQSDRKPSLQGSAELQLFDNLVYAGIAGYDVDLPTKPDAEIDFTAGIRPKWGPVTFDFGVIQYYYPGERRLVDPATGAIFTPANTDFLELAGKVSWNIEDRFILGAGVFHAWDWLGSGAPGTYVNATAKYNIPAMGVLPAGFAISGELGHYSLGRTSPQLGSIELVDYLYWNAGVSYTWKNLTVDLRYHDTDLNKNECFINTTDPRGIATGTARSKWCDTAFVATLSLDFTASQLGVFAPAR
jgi:uncharacterized protein (TIGR02001 family)